MYDPHGKFVSTSLRALDVALAASITEPFRSDMFVGYDRPGSLRLPLIGGKQSGTASPEQRAARKAQRKARAMTRRTRK